MIGTTIDVLREVLTERERQDALHGEANQSNTLLRWHAILAEEYGEFAKEVVEASFGKGDRTALRSELIQTAAVAVAIVEWLDAEAV